MIEVGSCKTFRRLSESKQVYHVKVHVFRKQRSFAKPLFWESAQTNVNLLPRAAWKAAFFLDCACIDLTRCAFLYNGSA